MFVVFLRIIFLGFDIFFLVVLAAAAADAGAGRVFGRTIFGHGLFALSAPLVGDHGEAGGGSGCRRRHGCLCAVCCVRLCVYYLFSLVGGANGVISPWWTNLDQSSLLFYLLSMTWR